MPGDPSKPLQMPTPDPTSALPGAPANAVWDPVQKRWVGGASGAGGPGSGVGGPMPGPTARPAGSTWDPDQQAFVPESTGMSNAQAPGYGGNGQAGTMDGSAPTEGRVGGYDPNVGSTGAWGGYVGTMVRNPDGTVTMDGSQNGTTADINRFQGLGHMAAMTPAYQIDYGQANQDAAMGADARQGQQYAIDGARSAANGDPSVARNLGWDMLRQGAQTQQAAAASTRGGSLAEAAAMHQQQGGQAAYMQQGNNAMGALRADEMATGRQQYAQMAGAQRAGDATAQGLHQQQAIGQMGQELGQRQLNQTGQMGYEGMAQNVDKASQDAALKQHEMDSGIDAAASMRATNSANRDQQQNAALIASGGTIAAGVSKQFADPAQNDPNHPGSRYDGSDERMKRNVQPMSLAECAARWGSR